MTRALVFGGTGALGSAIVAELADSGWVVDVASRSASEGSTIDLSRDDWPDAAAARGPYQGVVWAQGINMSGGVLEAEPDDLRKAYEANVVFIADSLRRLTVASALSNPARGVVISSVWQVAARSNKIAYVASKAALSGLVPAIAIDMAERSFAINGVLPGVIDTPMTRAQLSDEQLKKVQAETIGGALATPENV
ncbi:MAG: SDR family NAD(P)-dependent oxidoreductase, partial [Lacisediminihabitans sp.]